MDVKITEVSPRDGLQNEKGIISTESKKQFIDLLIAAGCKELEATSFVRKEAIPQLSDATELAHMLDRTKDVNYACLTPNLKGYESALQAGFREVAVFTAASETFSQKNTNASIEKSLQRSAEVAKRAIQDGIRVRGYVSTVVDCPYEGRIDPQKVQEVCLSLLEMGIYEISLGETIGTAVPSEVEELLKVLLKEIPAEKLAGHFHDTYGMAIANVDQSFRMGIRSFDSSAGGLGGCPYAKGAAGNLATEDLVYYFQKKGIGTGIDLEKLTHASHFMEQQLGRSLISKTYLAIRKRNS